MDACRDEAPASDFARRQDKGAEVDARLWNIGVKVEDVKAEADYFVALGAELRIHETLATPDGTFEYALLDFAGTRLFLTPVTVFDDRLAVPSPLGLTHAVFEVADVDAELERLVALGTEVLIPPIEVSAALGTRRLAFCRSPGGLVFEVLQIRVSLV
jgi:catechol 2,3-dioxygenase-like lactoylglutathione lyase family enzyme